jgi:class 3 adenylate cyclase/tetratricopeptide (TPR) repeat protein
VGDTTLGRWLTAHGLESLLEVFVAQDVTLDVLTELTEDDLRDLGLSIGMRRRLRKALATHPPDATALTAAPSGNPFPQPGDVEAQRRRITVVFIDLVGSTELSAQLDPEDLREHINAFQQCASAVVVRYGGFVARFMGDGLLAYFGYPIAHENDAERAVRAGLEAIEAIADLPAKATPARARVGIATGLVVVGDVISSGETRERSVVGETPNLAARLQAIAAPGQVVVASTTHRLVADAFSFRSLPAQKLKGFDEPVSAYAAGAPRAIRSRFDARGSSGLMPLLGRDMELSLLGERWELACGGEGQAVLLVGEAGIGKSRIAHALIEHVRAQHHRCLVNQCSPLHLDSPLWPVLDQIRRASRFEEQDPPASRLERLDTELALSSARASEGVALIAQALGLPPPPGSTDSGLSAKQKRLRVLQALLERLLNLASQRPLLVVVEDVHWVDPTTKELIDAVLDAIGDERVMVLMTTRPEGAPELEGQAHVTKLTLNRLSRQAVHSIICHIAGERALPEALLGGIVSRTDGVPLFVEELTKAVLEAGPCSPDSRASFGSDRLDAAIPDTLHDSLMARLDRVPAVKGVAQIAACIGREFDFELLGAICDMPRGEIEDALDTLACAGLVFQRGSPPAARYSFKHALVRDAAYESMLNARCREVHGRIADALESKGASAPPELVALHAAHAGDAERAIESYLAAGRRAAQASANAEAVSHYRQALDLLATQPAGPARDERELGVLQALGVPLIAVRGYASSDVERVFQRARVLCEALAVDDERAFMVLRGLWNCLYDRSELVDSASLAAALVTLASAHDNPAEQALAYRALGSTAFVQGELARGADAFQRVLDNPQGWSSAATRAMHGEAPEVVARQYAGWVATLAGRPDTGLALVEEGLARARQIELPIAVAFSLAILELTLWLRGEAERCARIADETGALCAEQGFPFWGAHSGGFAGWSAAQAEPDAQALARTRAGLDAWLRTGAMLHVPTWSCVLAAVALDAGELDEAESVLQRARRLAERSGELFMLPELLRLAARLARLRGDAGAAPALLDRALEVSARHGSHWLGLRAATDRARHDEAGGDERAALARLDDAIGRVAEGRACRVLRQRLRAALVVDR